LLNEAKRYDHGHAQRDVLRAAARRARRTRTTKVHFQSDRRSHWRDAPRTAVTQRRNPTSHVSGDNWLDDHGHHRAACTCRLGGHIIALHDQCQAGIHRILRDLPGVTSTTDRHPHARVGRHRACGRPTGTGRPLPQAPGKWPPRQRHRPP